MTIPLSIPVENIDEVLETYDELEIYRDTSATGTFSTLVTTLTLDSDTTLYTYDDANGDSGSWYRHRFHNDTGPVNSEYSPPWRPHGLTLEELCIQVAEDAGTGFRSTCTSDGGADALIDAALSDSGVDSSFLEGAWVYRPNADSVDRLRRVKSFTTASGTLVPTRDWSVAPAEDEVYHVYLLLPPVDAPGAPGSYRRAVRLGLSRVWFEDEFLVGEGTEDGKTRFDVSAFLPHILEAHQVIFRRYDSNTGYPHDRNVGKNGGFWRLIKNGRFDVQLELITPPSTDDEIWAKAYRQQDPVYRDDDVTDCPNDMAVAAGKYGLFLWMTQIRPGSYTGELALAESEFATKIHQSGIPSSMVVGL